MDFRSIYQHGFARVAACTPPDRDRRPARQRRGDAAPGAGVHEEGVAVAVFPELGLYGLLDRGPAAAGRGARRRRERARDGRRRDRPTCCRVLVVGAPLRHRNRIYNCAVVVHRGRVLGVAPKSYLPTYREFYERRQIAPGDDERGEIRVGGADVPFGPDLLFAAEDVPGLVLHAEICEDMWVPSRRAPRPRWPARPCWSTSPAARSRSAAPRTASCCAGRQSSRCLAAYVYAAAGAGRVDHRPVLGRPDDDLRERRAAGRERALPRRRRGARSPTSTSTCCARSACGWAPSTTTAARTPRAPAPSAGSPSRSTRRTATSACGAGRALPVRPADPARLEQDCYEAYNIQVAGLQQRLRRDRRAEGRHRRLRRPGLHARADRRRAGDGPRAAARAATSWPSRCPASPPSEHTKDNATGSCARSASPRRSSTSRRPPG